MCSKCTSKNDHHNDLDKCHESCVEEILEAILAAQKKVEKADECKNSCNESIKELLGKSKKSKKNTIPFILYCGGCKPFKATGVTTISTHNHKKKFVCITSFIFRIVDIDDNCAVLELLTFKSNMKCEDKDLCSPCSQIDHEDVDDLIRTGICINIDLSCLCAITCLPAVHV
jgi:spore coat protein Z